MSDVFNVCISSAYLETDGSISAGGRRKLLQAGGVELRQPGRRHSTPRFGFKDRTLDLVPWAHLVEKRTNKQANKRRYSHITYE